MSKNGANCLFALLLRQQGIFCDWLSQVGSQMRSSLRQSIQFNSTKLSHTMKFILTTLLCSALTLSASQAGKKAKNPDAKKDGHANLEAKFAKLDKNSDGQISKEEFMNSDKKKDKAGKKGKKAKGEGKAKGKKKGKKGKKGKKNA